MNTERLAVGTGEDQFLFDTVINVLDGFEPKEQREVFQLLPMPL